MMGLCVRARVFCLDAPMLSITDSGWVICVCTLRHTELKLRTSEVDLPEMLI